MIRWIIVILILSSVISTVYALDAQAQSAFGSSSGADSSNTTPTINDLAALQDKGTDIIWTAKATDPDGDQIFYRFFLNNKSKTDWITNNKWTMNATDAKVGNNTIDVQIRDGKHKGPDGNDNAKSIQFTLSPVKSKAPTAQVSESCPGGCDDYSGNCLELLYAGNYEDALKCYESATKCFENATHQNPNNAYCWYYLGSALNNLGLRMQDVKRQNNPGYRYNSDTNKISQFDDAIKALDRATDLDPRYANAWNTKGVIFEEQGKFNEATKCYSKAIEIEPSSSLFKRNRDRVSGKS